MKDNKLDIDLILPDSNLCLEIKKNWSSTSYKSYASCISKYFNDAAANTAITPSFKNSNFQVFAKHLYSRYYISQNEIDGISADVKTLRTYISKAAEQVWLNIEKEGASVVQFKDPPALVEEKFSESFYTPARVNQWIEKAEEKSFKINSQQILFESLPVQGAEIIEYSKLVGSLESISHHSSIHPISNQTVSHFKLVLDDYLDKYLTTNDQAYLFSAYALVQEFHEKVKTHERELTNRLRYLAKKKFKSFKQDLRHCYRMLLRFLFKNMDSDTDHSKSYTVLSKQDLLKFNQYNNDKLGNHNVFQLGNRRRSLYQHSTKRGVEKSRCAA